MILTQTYEMKTGFSPAIRLWNRF